MGVRNYLIEGVSGTGKTSVCHELRRRGYHAINGDTDLAYQGDPETGEPRSGRAHAFHIWDVDKVRALAADRSFPATFFCGGSRNVHRFIDVFDTVFVLDVDWDTLSERLAQRSEDEFGGKESEREFVQRMHATKEDIPAPDVLVDATAPLPHVASTILRHCGV